MTPSFRAFTFDHLPAGEAVAAMTLDSGAGVTATILAYGATLQALTLPDRQGQVADIVLGHDTIGPYVERPFFLGVTVGRFANRIARGRFTLDGIDHQVSLNDGVHSLHGGRQGFDKRLWTLHAPVVDPDGVSVRLWRRSPDGEEGYPGNLDVAVTYRLGRYMGRDNVLAVAYEATTDRPTVVSLTNHALYNLRGGGSALDAELTLHADDFTPIDEGLIPTGERRAVAGTPFDFRHPRRLDADVRDASDAQIRVARGYDHNFALRGGVTADPRPVARLHDRASGRGVEIATTLPGLQLYTGNFFDGTLIGKGGRAYRQGDGIALETQHFPDAPNRPTFPSARLNPGEVYRHTSLYRLFVD
jgi:aldose 1-epimerase